MEGERAAAGIEVGNCLALWQNRGRRQPGRPRPRSSAEEGIRRQVDDGAAEDNLRHAMLQHRPGAPRPDFQLRRAIPGRAGAVKSAAAFDQRCRACAFLAATNNRSRPVSLSVTSRSTVWPSLTATPADVGAGSARQQATASAHGIPRDRRWRGFPEHEAELQRGASAAKVACRRVPGGKAMNRVCCGRLSPRCARTWLTRPSFQSR